MNKIGIVTYHGSENYGSVLQAYALQKTVSNITEKPCKIINYVSDEQKNLYKIFFKPINLKSIVKNLIVLKKIATRKFRKKTFIKFRKNKLHINNESFNTISLNHLDPNEFSTIIFGSDQIWNVRIPDCNDFYFSSFTSNARKISYAASMGGLNPNLNKNEQNHLSNLLERFSAISVREEIAKSVISSFYNKDIAVNVDPVFLLTKDDWLKLSTKEEVAKKYIFFYSIDNNDDSIEIAKWYSNKFKLPVVVLFTSWKSYLIESKTIKWAKNQAPEDFISLIYNAELVLSGSFHGTAFSLIFNKPFYRIQKQVNNKLIFDDRIATLFKKLEIDNREININNYKDYSDNIFNINYFNINKKIEVEREKAIKFLFDNLK